MMSAATSIYPVEEFKRVVALPPPAPSLPPHAQWSAIGEFVRWDDFLTFSIRQLVHATPENIDSLLMGAERLAPSSTAQAQINHMRTVWSQIDDAFHELYEAQDLHLDECLLWRTRNTPLRLFSDVLFEQNMLISNEPDFTNQNDAIRAALNHFVEALERFQLNELSSFSQIEQLLQSNPQTQDIDR